MIFSSEPTAALQGGGGAGGSAHFENHSEEGKLIPEGDVVQLKSNSWETAIVNNFFFLQDITLNIKHFQETKTSAAAYSLAGWEKEVIPDSIKKQQGVQPPLIPPP